MEDFLKFLIAPLLSSPKALEIRTHPGAIVIKVADDDIAKIIGKHGSVINHLRNLLKTYCALHNLPTITLTLDAPAKA